MTAPSYRMRYFVEPWDKPPEGVVTRTDQPGVSVSSDNYGYADALLVSESPDGRPTKDTLLLALAHIEHYLKEHLGG